MKLLYDTYRGNDSLEISKASLKRWQREYDSLLAFMSADFRDLLDGLYARVYLVGSDLVIESEACGGACIPGKPFDPHYEVMTVAVEDAKKHMWSNGNACAVCGLPSDSHPMHAADVGTVPADHVFKS